MCFLTRIKLEIPFLVDMILSALSFFPAKRYIDLFPDEPRIRFAPVLGPVPSRTRKNSSIVEYRRGLFGIKSYLPSYWRFNMLGEYSKHLLSFGAV